MEYNKNNKKNKIDYSGISIGELMSNSNPGNNGELSSEPGYKAQNLYKNSRLTSKLTCVKVLKIWNLQRFFFILKILV